jgi:hypothetical protein
MDGVATKIAQEIGVLFQHLYINSGACEQIAAHHARGAAPDYATTRGDRFGGWIFLGHDPAPLSVRVMARLARVALLKSLTWKRGDWRGRAVSQQLQ